MTEEALRDIIRSCIKKEPDAQKSLYNYSYVKLMHIPRRYVNSLHDAKWHFNLSMLKVFDSLESFDLTANYLPWASTILIRSTIDQLRKDNKFKMGISVVESNVLEASGGFELNAALNDLSYEDIMSLIDRLEDKQRIVFSLHEIDDHTHEEIEGLTGIKSNTSKWLLAKAKKSFKQLLTSTKMRGYGKL